MTMLHFPSEHISKLDQVCVVEMVDVQGNSVHWKVDGYLRGLHVLDFGLWPDFDRACSRARFHARDYLCSGYEIASLPNPGGAP